MKNGIDLRVTLIQYNDVAPTTAPVSAGPTVKAERYAMLSGVSHVLLVTWEGDPSGSLHMFSRETGRCLESRAGVMRGWHIDAAELRRVDPGHPKNVSAAPDPAPLNQIHLS